jgi:hemerythrin-like domain-containing protein
MNKPAQILFAEHEVITNAIAVMNEAENHIHDDSMRYETLMKTMLLFFRNYADKYHHWKEEEVLFPEMIKKNELLEDGAIKEMLENHDDFRIMLRDAEVMLEKKAYDATSKMLHVYAEALLDHIAVENEEIFQMLETLFDESELEKIYFRFEDCDNELGLEDKIRMEELIQKLSLPRHVQ